MEAEVSVKDKLKMLSDFMNSPVFAEFIERTNDLRASFYNLALNSEISNDDRVKALENINGINAVCNTLRFMYDFYTSELNNNKEQGENNE